ncbi:MAG: hypothetical protein LBJ04_08685 [Sphingobacterium sp.]|uniref:hypothetical protein n=1 Tax=Sphingobacterium sp. TaxID=341027 RepID=UPI0028197BD2|nr:hypothetical protein [Sphingobacterium sp.]MDR0263288.1 hypothetical protein [Sphingobacterium sp.]
MISSNKLLYKGVKKAIQFLDGFFIVLFRSQHVVWFYAKKGIGCSGCLRQLFGIALVLLWDRGGIASPLVRLLFGCGSAYWRATAEA